MNANGGRGTVGFVALNPVNVDDPLFAVNLGDLSLPSSVFTPNNFDFIILAYGYGACLIWSARSINSRMYPYLLVEHTLYLARSSFDSAEDIIFRRIEEGAEKWALRAFRREEETSEAMAC